MNDVPGYRVIEGAELDEFVRELEAFVDAEDAKKAKSPKKGRKRKKPDDSEERDVEAEIEEAAGKRHIIYDTDEEHLLNEEIVAGLGLSGDIFQRSGSLVSVDFSSDANCFAIRPIAKHRLRHEIFKAVMIVSVGEKDWSKIKPKAANVNAVHELGDWPGIPHLRGIATVPVLRPDGSVWNQAGYDFETGFYLPAECVVPDLPANVSRDDAAAAVRELAGTVNDFPFRELHDFSAWLSAFLTALARPSVDGCVPVFIIAANVPGAGKSKLADVIANILTGHDMPRTVSSRDDDEMRKRVTGVLMSGDPLQLIDNVDEAEFGGAWLDALATARTWKDRALGRNEIVTLPNETVWLATMNNPAIRGDSARRMVATQLETSEERPEERSEFQHADLTGYVRGRREVLIAAGLAILRGYIAAGRPPQGLRSFGSFEAWSNLIRSSIVWAGLPDPLAGAADMARVADNAVLALDQLLSGLQLLDPYGHGVTTRELIDESMRPTEAGGLLQESLAALTTKPDSVQQVAQRLGRLRNRRVGGRHLSHREGGGRRRYWFVVVQADDDLVKGHDAEKDLSPNLSLSPGFKNTGKTSVPDAESERSERSEVFSGSHTRSLELNPSHVGGLKNTAGENHSPGFTLSLPTSNSPSPRTSHPPHDARQPDDQQPGEPPPDEPGPSPDESAPPPTEEQATNVSQEPTGGSHHALF